MIKKSEVYMEYGESHRIIDSESVLIDLQIANYWVMRAIYEKMN